MHVYWTTLTCTWSHRETYILHYTDTHYTLIQTTHASHTCHSHIHTHTHYTYTPPHTCITPPHIHTIHAVTHSPQKNHTHTTHTTHTLQTHTTNAHATNTHIINTVVHAYKCVVHTAHTVRHYHYIRANILTHCAHADTCAAQTEHIDRHVCNIDTHSFLFMQCWYQTCVAVTTWMVSPYVWRSFIFMPFHL